MSVLIVVAHPDDEVLGCGGAAAYFAAQGIAVHSCILSSQVDARRQRPEAAQLQEDLHRAQAVLGLQEPILGTFPNIHFNTVGHLKLVQFIEDAIVHTGADVIFTHHPHDLNNDHHHTSLACQAAVRLFQRRPHALPPLRAFYFMEVLSSTDWAFRGQNNAFQPDTFMELGRGLLDRKLEALQVYRGVMREFPHPRSREIIEGLAAYRGGQAGMHYAEAFQTAFRALRSLDSIR